MKAKKQKRELVIIKSVYEKTSTSFVTKAEFYDVTEKNYPDQIMYNDEMYFFDRLEYEQGYSFFYKTRVKNMAGWGAKAIKLW